jgi:hypothetical protein
VARPGAQGRHLSQLDWPTKEREAAAWAATVEGQATHIATKGFAPIPKDATVADLIDKYLENFKPEPGKTKAATLAMFRRKIAAHQGGACSSGGRGRYRAPIAIYRLFIQEQVFAIEHSFLIHRLQQRIFLGQRLEILSECRQAVVEENRLLVAGELRSHELSIAALVRNVAIVDKFQYVIEVSKVMSNVRLQLTVHPFIGLLNTV